MKNRSKHGLYYWSPTASLVVHLEDGKIVTRKMPCKELWKSFTKNMPEIQDYEFFKENYDLNKVE